MSVIDAKYRFLEKQAIQRLPSKIKEIYADLIKAEVDGYTNEETSAVQVVTSWHNMTEDEVKECMMKVYDFIEEYIQTHNNKFR